MSWFPKWPKFKSKLNELLFIVAIIMFSIVAIVIVVKFNDIYIGKKGIDFRTLNLKLDSLSASVANSDSIINSLGAIYTYADITKTSKDSIIDMHNALLEQNSAAKLLIKDINTLKTIEER